MPYVRTVKTTSGATAVQIVWSSRRGSREIEHLGSAHDEAELEALKAAARQRIAAGQAGARPGPGAPRAGGPLPITVLADGPPAGRAGRAYRVLGLRGRGGRGRGVPARWCWPGSSSRPASWTPAGAGRGRGRRRRPTATLKRRLPAYAERTVAAAAVGGVRGARPARPGQPGALRRVHALLRDRPGRRVPRARVLQGTPAGAADHHRPADRRRTGSR